MIKKVIKHRIVEIIGVLINLILISKYFFDKLTICCEPCKNGSGWRKDYQHARH